MAENERHTSVVAKKHRHSPEDTGTSRNRVPRTAKTTDSHNEHATRQGRFIKSEKSSSFKDKSRQPREDKAKYTNQRKGTFVKEDSVVSNELIHPRIGSSSHYKLTRNRMQSESTYEDKPLGSSSTESAGIPPILQFEADNDGYSESGRGSETKSPEPITRSQVETLSKSPRSVEKPDSDVTIQREAQSRNGVKSPASDRTSEQHNITGDDVGKPLESKQNTQIKTDTLKVQSVQNISPKERNVVVVSGKATPVDNINSDATASGQNTKSEESESQLGTNEPADKSAPLEPPLVVTETIDDVKDEQETPRDNAEFVDQNLLSVVGDKPNSPPPQIQEEDLGQMNTTQQDLDENWDQRSHTTEKSSMPGEPILYKKPAKSAKRKAGYDPQEMIRNASRQQEETPRSTLDPGPGAAQREKTLEDERVLKLTEMLNQMGEQLNRVDSENKRLKSQNRVKDEEIGQYKVTQEKANNEIEIIKGEWQKLTSELEAKQAENEKLRQEALVKTDDDVRMRELNEEQAKLRLENSSLKNDMRELLTARQNENKAHESRIKELEALMVTKEADLATTKSGAEKEKTEQSNELNALRDEIERLKAENEALLEEISLLKAEIQRQSEVISRLNAENQTGSTEIAKLRDENKILTEEKLKFQIENSTLKEKIAELEKQIEQLKITIENLNKENQKLLSSLSKAENDQEKMKDVAKKIKHLEQELELANREKEFAQKTLQEREKVFATDFLSQEQLKLALQNAEAQNDKFSKEVNNLSEENASLKQQATSKASDMEKLMLKVVELNERSENNAITLASMADLVKEKQSHIDDLRTEIQTLKATNSNYFNTLENMTSSRKQDEDVVKAKYEDMETAHKKLLEENKRLRTVLAHKNMNETNRDSEKEALSDKLYETEIELAEAQERVQHLEAMLDDVYKAREITGSRISKQNGFFDEGFESHQGKNSLPDIQSQPRRERQRGGANRRDELAGQSAKTSSSGRSWELRRYRYADSYTKRFENRPSKLKKTGVVTQLR